MQLTFFTDYSLRTLMYLLKKGDQRSSVKEISEYYDISHNHLIKVAHRLSMLGYVQTTKGKGGGLKITPGIETQRLGDLIAQLEPHMDMVECFNKTTNTCRITDSCKLKHYLLKATKAFISTLNEYTLADTIENKNVPFVWEIL